MTRFEDIIERDGRLGYTNIGDSMCPLIRQDRDILIIEKPQGKLKKYDVPLYKRDNGQYVLHRILKVRENDYVICGDNRYGKEYGKQLALFMTIDIVVFCPDSFCIQYLGIPRGGSFKPHHSLYICRERSAPGGIP